MSSGEYNPDGHFLFYIQNFTVYEERCIIYNSKPLQFSLLCFFYRILLFLKSTIQFNINT